MIIKITELAIFLHLFIEIIYILGMLIGITIWKEIHTQYELTLYIVEIILLIIFFSFWLCTKYYNVKSKNEFKLSSTLIISSILLIGHGFFSYKVFTNPYSTNIEILMRRIYAIICWIFFILFAIFIQITKLNHKKEIQTQTNDNIV